MVDGRLLASLIAGTQSEPSYYVRLGDLSSSSRPHHKDETVVPNSPRSAALDSSVCDDHIEGLEQWRRDMATSVRNISVSQRFILGVSCDTLMHLLFCV